MKDVELIREKNGNELFYSQLKSINDKWKIGSTHKRVQLKPEYKRSSTVIKDYTNKKFTPETL